MLSGVSLPEGVGIVGHVGEVIECLSSSVETITSVALFDTIGFYSTNASPLATTSAIACF